MTHTRKCARIMKASECTVKFCAYRVNKFEFMILVHTLHYSMDLNTAW